MNLVLIVLQIVTEYGDENAQAALDEFVDYMVDYTEINYSRDLSRPVRFAISKLEIWKTQPATLANDIGWYYLLT